ncbi:uncharacterized protein LOC101845781 [Aplysia californica]|uniref:Uncharacterized protein LOC101845781 n=1 Tax=Aplysia californica TaxID=6500 RepID=A0ABM0JUK1_APLCA|nr:uncharacterized protein LOC101845781 [Aplysia californica]
MDKYDCFLEAGGFIDETSDITEEDDVFKEVDLHDIDTDLPDTLEADCSLNRWVSELSISELQDEALPVVNSEGAQLGLGHTEAPDKDCETTERLGPLEQSLKTLPPRYVRGIRRTVSEPTGSLNKSLSEALKDEIGCMIRFRRFTAGYEEFEEEDKPRKNILTMEDIRRRELVRQRNKKHAKASRERFHQLLEDLKEVGTQIHVFNVVCFWFHLFIPAVEKKNYII